MPMTILFFSFAALVLLNEIEISLHSNGSIQWRDVFKFKTARKSVAIIFGILVVFILFVIEVKLFSDGRIYLNGDKYSSLIRAAFIVCLCFLAVAYRATIVREQVNLNKTVRTQTQKRLLLGVGAAVFIVFLIMQFQLLFS